MENVLKYYGLHKVVNSAWKEENPPTATASDDDRKKYEEKHEKWVKADCHAMARLTFNMEKEVHYQFRICKSTRKNWLQLQTLYEQKSNLRLDILYCELFNYKKNASDDVIIHVTKMQTLW